MLELDRNARKFEQFIENCEPKLTCTILKRLLPCTCNLDPYLIKLIKESIEATNERAQMNKSAAAAALMANNLQQPLDIYNQTSVLVNRYQPIMQQQQLQQQQQSFYQQPENKCIFFFGDPRLRIFL